MFDLNLSKYSCLLILNRAMMFKLFSVVIEPGYQYTLSLISMITDYVLSNTFSLHFKSMRMSMSIYVVTSVWVSVRLFLTLSMQCYVIVYSNTEPSYEWYVEFVFYVISIQHEPALISCVRFYFTVCSSATLNDNESIVFCLDPCLN